MFTYSFVDSFGILFYIEFRDRSRGVARATMKISRSQTQHTLYTPEERKRRDESPWTLVQGILAIVQFVVFLISLGLVLRYLATGEGFLLASISIVIKTLVLYTIMVTGSIWERDVFGKYLFAKPFFWEDVVSILVLALHTAYLIVFFFGFFTAHDQMLIALVAYSSYIVNAMQFLFKFRLARLENTTLSDETGAALGAAR